jgi:hypothetical protein
MTRSLAGGLTGAIAWILGMLAFFGPAQRVLTNPELQSGKFLQVFGALEPLPRMVAAPWVVPVGLLVIATIHSFVYRFLEPALRGRPVARGLQFGLVAWALMVPWFEFYLPWNVMHEPAPLVLLEAVCWLAVQLLVGVVIALTQAAIGRRRKATIPPE